jgi:hypothetical protein
MNRSIETTRPSAYSLAIALGTVVGLDISEDLRRVSLEHQPRIFATHTL